MCLASCLFLDLYIDLRPMEMDMYVCYICMLMCLSCETVDGLVA